MPQALLCPPDTRRQCAENNAMLIKQKLETFILICHLEPRKYDGLRPRLHSTLLIVWDAHISSKESKATSAEMMYLKW